MMNPSYKGRALLPMPVIEAARAGDAGAVEQVLRYYEGYINKLYTRTLYDEYGNPYVCLPRIRFHDLRHPYVKPTTKKYLFFLVPMIQLS
jgi:hypothetical protein